AQHNDMPFEDLKSLLDLVAVSTACDIVPVIGENRVLCQLGLERLNHKPRPGIRAMLEMANVKRALDVTDLVFILGPRINAAGRIEHGQQAVELLLAADMAQAEELGKRVDRSNTERQGLDKEITAQALEMIEQDPVSREAFSTVLFDPSWHKGVIGIVASRLIEQHYRPTIVLTESQGKVAGSARSVKGFDVYKAIEACAHLVDQFGGHMYAAGLTMQKENVQAFKEAFEAEVARTILPEQCIPEEDVDVEIDLGLITPSFLNAVAHMAPFGPGNMKPVFLTRGLQADASTSRVVGDGHLKLAVRQDTSQPYIDAIAFRQAQHMELLRSGEAFSMLYTVEWNEWNGRRSIQLNVKDIKPGTKGLLVEERARQEEAELEDHS
ncbi:MAG: single-stranded-DNA-specific exonuclease RecJ, partial [Flavobacteriales bacterium]|nr:single-stranded-DNA-specific exonuclease RecJ [Flavobacteriales bacterium]